MVRDIVKDTEFLRLPSEKATKSDIQIAKDLLDTLVFHKDDCVGLAANMIGYRKNIIAIDLEFAKIVMINPKITRRLSPYTAKEGCLSLPGKREANRYKTITVEFDDMNFVHHENEYTGFPAQIIQHEMDHLAGILI